MAGTYSGGDGSEDSPYQIAITDDLIELSNTSSDWDKHFIQTDDIYFGADEEAVDWNGDGSAIWDAEDQKGFSPIGYPVGSNPGFAGSYDGGGYTITNLYINRTDGDNIGLFGLTISDAKIENLGLENVSISGSDYYRLGALVGWINGSGDTVENCYSTGTIDVTDSGSVGGLVGVSNGSVIDSYSDVTLSADIVDGGFHLGGLGGLVGWNSGSVSNSRFTGTVIVTGVAGNVEELSGVGALMDNNAGSVDSSHSSGDVNAKNCIYVGGLIGGNNGSLNKSYFTGTVTGDNTGPVGGLAGVVSSGSVSNSYSTGSVDISNPASGYENFGGLVGRNGSSTSNGVTLDSSYSTGSVDISNSNGVNVGGLVGQNYSSATVNNSYSMASVTINSGSSDDNVGGLVGYNYWESTVNNSYSIGTVTSDTAGNVGGLVGDNYDDNCIVSSSFWDTQTSGQDSSDGGTGKTTAEMKEACTFISAGWIFASAGTTADGTWTIDEFGTDNNGYPALAWQEMNNSYGPCAPVVQTKDPSNITSTSATLNGEIITDAGSEITTRGVCWSTSPEPTTADDNTTDVTGTDEFNADVTGLSSETTYYVRAYAESNIGMSYGNEVSFATAPTYSGGSGTESDPYKIATTSDLISLSNFSGHWDKHFIQTADISFGENETQVDWNGDGSAGPTEGFSPIGNADTQFTGAYDGGNHNITNLYINRPGENEIGLFGYTGASTIENLGLIDVAITGNSFVGGLVGRNSSTVHSCYSTGSVDGGQYAVEGLVGNNDGGTVSSSYSTASVGGSQYIGGLVGYNYANGTVSKSYSTGEVSGSFNIGGLVGGNHFVETTVSNSYSTASVGGDQFVGGLLGVNEGKGPYQGTVVNCYSTGAVSGSYSYIGGLVAVNGGIVSNSFWDKWASGQDESAGGTGRTTNEMKDVATFTDEITVGLDAAWDFVNNPNDDEADEDYWDIDINQNKNKGYPFLVWQDFPPTVNTDEVASIDLTSATGGGEITNLGTSNLTAHGVCWSTSENPTTNDDCTDKGGTSETGAFTADITGLTPSTEYHVRAFAANDAGTSYGEDKTFTTDSLNGSGTSADPYEIQTWYELDALRHYLGQQDIYFELTGDLDKDTEGYDQLVSPDAVTQTTQFFGDWSGVDAETELKLQTAPVASIIQVVDTQDDSELAYSVNLENGTITLDQASDKQVKVTYTAKGLGWNPIGVPFAFAPVPSGAFKGAFNGQQHQIQDLYINRPYEMGVGLFAATAEPVVVEKVQIENTDIIGGYHVGPLVGWAVMGSHIEDIETSGTVWGMQNVGGLLGNIDQSIGTVSNCRADVHVSGGQNVGGLSGALSSSTLRNSTAHGDVTAVAIEGIEQKDFGGLAGKVSGGFSKNSYIGNNYASGAVLAPEAKNVGGLIGSVFGQPQPGTDTRVSNSYFSGSVQGGENTGGLVGNLGDNAVVEHSFWDTDTSKFSKGVGSEDSDPDGATGKTTAEMKAKSTFSDWTFDQDKWAMSDGNSRPYLTWEGLAVDNGAAEVSGTTASFAYGNLSSNSNDDLTLTYGYMYRKDTPPAFGENDTQTKKVGEGEALSAGADLSFLDTELTDLDPATTYYARAYATDGTSVWYGDTVKFVTEAMHNLAVNNGSGDGDYVAGTEVNIQADDPPSGQEFDKWTGDAEHVADVNSASTTVTMPAADVSVTATYFISSIIGEDPVNPTHDLEASISGEGDYNWRFAKETEGFIPVSGDPDSPDVSPPAGYDFPHGLFDFVLEKGEAGSVAVITIDYFSPLPEGTVYWKFGATAQNTTPHWYILPEGNGPGTMSFSADRSSITLRIQDGELGDHDLKANSWIYDPGGLGVPVVSPGPATPVPTMTEWRTIILSILLALSALYILRRRYA